MAKSAAAAVARRVGRVSVTTAGTNTTLDPNLKRGLTNSSSPAKTSAGAQENAMNPIGARLSRLDDCSPRYDSV
jgi:hypothetical protein